MLSLILTNLIRRSLHPVGQIHRLIGSVIRVIIIEIGHRPIRLECMTCGWTVVMMQSRYGFRQSISIWEIYWRIGESITAVFLIFRLVKILIAIPMEHASRHLDLHDARRYSRVRSLLNHNHTVLQLLFLRTDVDHLINAHHVARWSFDFDCWPVIGNRSPRIIIASWVLVWHSTNWGRTKSLIRWSVSNGWITRSRWIVSGYSSRPTVIRRLHARARVLWIRRWISAIPSAVVRIPWIQLVGSARHVVDRRLWLQCNQFVMRIRQLWMNICRNKYLIGLWRWTEVLWPIITGLENIINQWFIRCRTILVWFRLIFADWARWMRLNETETEPLGMSLI